MSQSKYEPVGSENEVREDETRKPRSHNTIHWIVHFVQLAILVSVLGVFYAKPWTSLPEKKSAEHRVPVVFTDDVFHANSTGEFDSPAEYVGLPSDELDGKWQNLYHQFVTVDEKETQLSVYHQMWCLDFVRKMTTPYYYFPDAGIEDLGRLAKQRLHCIDQLRQYVMCNADLTEMPLEEVDGVKIGSSQVEHQCANYQKILEKYS